MFKRKKYIYMYHQEEYEQCCTYHKDFHVYHRYLRYLRPFVFLFNLIVLYLLFRWIGNKVIYIFFAIFISTKEIVHLGFLKRIEKRIFKPMEDLKNAVDEIAKGNYNVKVDCEVTNEFGVLIHSFNEMARRLQESEKMKLAYEENRKTLIANISHDLKTPIAAIQGYIEAIADGVVTSPEKVNKYLKIIYHNTNYMNKLIDDLFLFSKLDMDKLDFQYEEILMRPFIEDIMEEFKLELEENQLGFDYIDKLEEDCYVNVDRKRIHQAIRNIIGNAVKYGSEKDLLIQTEMYRSDGFLCLSIKDNGPGIPTDKLPYVFDRFYRIDIERTKDFMSTGLGLAIAKELVARIKSHITRYERLMGQKSCIEVISHKGLEINTASHKVFVNGKEVQLTTKEYELLLFLASNPNIVFSKDQIFDTIWGEDYFGDTATVAVHIQKIRKKIEKDPPNPEYVEPIWGAGYRFNS